MTDQVWGYKDGVNKFLEESGGGSIPSGSGSPVGSVVPTGIGELYVDTNNGSLYIARGVTNADWIAVGGHTDGTVSGVQTSSTGGVASILGAVAVSVTDSGAIAGTGNGLVWNDEFGEDGTQRAAVYTGSTGQFTTVIADADGNFKPGHSIDVSGLPTANPGPGLLWLDSGVLTVGT